MIKGNNIINIISFTVVSGIFSSQLIPSFLNVEAFERKKFKKLLKYGVVHNIGETAAYFMIISVCFWVAGFNANYEWFWRALGILFGLGGVISLFVVIYHKVFNLVTPALTELTQERLQQNIKKRKRKWILHISILLAWLYSWQTLIT